MRPVERRCRLPLLRLAVGGGVCASPGQILRGFVTESHSKIGVSEVCARLAVQQSAADGGGIATVDGSVGVDDHLVQRVNRLLSEKALNSAAPGVGFQGADTIMQGSLEPAEQLIRRCFGLLCSCCHLQNRAGKDRPPKWAVDSGHVVGRVMQVTVEHGSVTSRGMSE